jgi:hypothetical protein
MKKSEVMSVGVRFSRTRPCAQLVSAVPPHLASPSGRGTPYGVRLLVTVAGSIQRWVVFVASHRVNARASTWIANVAAAGPLALTQPRSGKFECRDQEIVFPMCPEHHLTPALSPTSWRRGRNCSSVGRIYPSWVANAAAGRDVPRSGIDLSQNFSGDSSLFPALY